jgi:hypothetical protein
MMLLIQDAIVTALALGAVGLVARRVLGVFNPPSATPVCTSCSSCPAPRAAPRDDDAVRVPMTVIRRKAEGRRLKAEVNNS